MAKQKKSQANQESESNDSIEETSWSRKTKITLSVVAVFHLFAVFSAPWAIPQPSSQLARSVNKLTSPWTHMLYMRHGYRFFAPDPGPSHLILYEVATESGETIQGRFPDRNKHRPRLMYHRFFMISEHFWNLGISQTLSSEQQTEELLRAEAHLRKDGFVDQAEWVLRNLPPNNEIPSDEDIQRLVDDLKSQGRHHAARSAQSNLQEQRRGMILANRHRKAWLKGIANYLKAKHGGGSVRLWIQEHMIPEYNHVLDGGKLNDAAQFGPKHLVYTEDEVIQ